MRVFAILFAASSAAAEKSLLDSVSLLAEMRQYTIECGDVPPLEPFDGLLMDLYIDKVLTGLESSSVLADKQNLIGLVEGKCIEFVEHVFHRYIDRLSDLDAPSSASAEPNMPLTDRLERDFWAARRAANEYVRRFHSVMIRIRAYSVGQRHLTVFAHQPFGASRKHVGRDLISLQMDVSSRFREISLESNPEVVAMRVAQLHDFLSELEFAGFNDQQIADFCRPAYMQSRTFTVSLQMRVYELVNMLSTNFHSKN